MKTNEEKIEYYKHLIKRKEKIRVSHLLSIQKHLTEVKSCEEYIEKHKAQLEALQSVKKC